MPRQRAVGFFAVGCSLSFSIQPTEGYVPTRKREITIRFVTTSHGAKVSSFIDAISDLADDVTITCKALNRTTVRIAAEGAKANPAANRPEPFDNGEPSPNRPQLAYIAENGASHRRLIDVEASLKKLKLTKDQLTSRTWPRGSPQHRLKRAAATKHSKPSNGAAPN